MAEILPHRVLVIDDNPDVHEDFRKVLCADRTTSSALEAAEAELFGLEEQSAFLGKQYKFQVDSAFQGEPGLAKVYHAMQEGYAYDIAFVDVRMPPGWDGIHVTPKLWVADPELEVVICTAYSDYTWEQMFEKLGTSERTFVIKKPFDRMEVLQMAHTLVERRQRSRQNKANMKKALAAQDKLLEELDKKFHTEIIQLKQVSRPEA
jgi:two-component system, NtrC family, sensor kinase